MNDFGCFQWFGSHFEILAMVQTNCKFSFVCSFDSRTENWNVDLSFGSISREYSWMLRENERERKTSSSGLICNEATVNNQHRYDTKNPIYRFMGNYLNFEIPQQVTSIQERRAFNAMINRMVFAGFSMKIASWCVVKPSIMVLRIWRKLLWFKLFLSPCIIGCSHKPV